MQYLKVKIFRKNRDSGFTLKFEVFLFEFLLFENCDIFYKFTFLHLLLS